MTETLLIILIVLSLIILVVVLFRKPKIEVKSQLDNIKNQLIKFDSALDRTEKSIRDEFQRDRAESNESSRTKRE